MHAYYEDLVRFVRQRWDNAGTGPEANTGITPAALPPPPLLEDLLSTCYQASMLREEERPVQVRLMLAAPGLFPRQTCRLQDFTARCFPKSGPVMRLN